MVQQFSDDDGKAGEAGLHVRIRPARSDVHRHRHAALPARASWRRHCLGCAARLARYESLWPQGKSSFTSCAGRARRSNTARRWSREHRRLRAARSNPHRPSPMLFASRTFPRASPRCYRPVYLARRLLCGVETDLPKSAGACGRTANFSSISVVGRRMKLTGL